MTSAADSGFNKGGRHFLAYQELYQYHKKYIGVHASDKAAYWAEAVKEGGALIEKYKGLVYFSGMMLAVWDDLEREKHFEGGQMALTLDGMGTELFVKSPWD